MNCTDQREAVILTLGRQQEDWKKSMKAVPLLSTIVVAAGLTFLPAANAPAQKTQHQHYGENEQMAEPAPDGSLAPRLQNKGNYGRAILSLDRAVRIEDGLAYIEPPDWGLPTRHILGAVLLEAGRPEEAETVCWEDLRRNPESGWALFGVMQALRAQNKDEASAAIETRWRKAWPNPDFTLASTRP
jgi:tetratricopeptide (TPR) repeat protein